MKVTIQGVTWQVPLRGGLPWLSNPKQQRIGEHGTGRWDTEVFFSITDANTKWCWECNKFVPAEKFFCLVGVTFYAEQRFDGKNQPYCMGCNPRSAADKRYQCFVTSYNGMPLPPVQFELMPWGMYAGRG